MTPKDNLVQLCKTNVQPKNRELSAIMFEYELEIKDVSVVE